MRVARAPTVCWPGVVDSGAFAVISPAAVDLAAVRRVISEPTTIVMALWTALPATVPAIAKVGAVFPTVPAAVPAVSAVVVKVITIVSLSANGASPVAAVRAVAIVTCATRALSRATEAPAPSHVTVNPKNPSSRSPAAISGKYAGRVISNVEPSKISAAVAIVIVVLKLGTLTPSNPAGLVLVKVISFAAAYVILRPIGANWDASIATRVATEIHLREKKDFSIKNSK